MNITTLLYLTSIQGLNTKLWASKVMKMSILKISRLPLGNWELGVSKQNDIWVLLPWPNTKNTIKGKVVPSPSSGYGESWKYVFTYGSSVHQKCSNYALTNLLFGLCKSVWVIDLLIIYPSPHPEIPARPSTPKMLRAKEHAPTPFPFVVFIFKLKLSPSRSPRVHHMVSKVYLFYVGVIIL
jgi:hypothetical protein